MSSALLLECTDANPLFFKFELSSNDDPTAVFGVDHLRKNKFRGNGFAAAERLHYHSKAEWVVLIAHGGKVVAQK